MDANNLAYTANELAPHMDLTYYEYMPGVSKSISVNMIYKYFNPIDGGLSGLYALTGGGSDGSLVGISKTIRLILTRRETLLGYFYR